MLESWSGYEKADPLRAIFGGDPRRLALNSPLKRLPFESRSLRRTHTFIWFYVGTTDKLLWENEQFAGELGRLGIAHRFFVSSGAHSWSLWRRFTGQALLVASEHLARG